MTVCWAVDKEGCLTEGTFVVDVATEDNDSLNVTNDTAVKDEGTALPLLFFS
jgi:hypothetical protein